MGMAEKMSTNPARILGINKGDISVGRLADITIFDPKDTYEINAAEFASKGKNMPFEGRKVTGRVLVRFWMDVLFIRSNWGIIGKE